MSRDITVAESGGFEPPEACTSTVFETVPFVRSGNSPLTNLAGLAPGSEEGNQQLCARRLEHSSANRKLMV